MRKVILNLAVSLDGYIEGPNGEYDWCFSDQDYGMTDFLKRIDTIFFGRKSYEMMTASGNNTGSGPDPYRKFKKIVFSKTLESVDPSFSLVTGDIQKAVTQMKNEEGKDIWLFGGAGLTTSMINSGLIDEIGLAVHPILLGSGKHLFTELENRIKLTLVDTKTYSSGLVTLIYKVDQ